MNDSASSPPLSVTLDNSAMQISSSSLKNYVWNCLFISYQLIVEFLGNVAYQVEATPVDELVNNLGLK